MMSFKDKANVPIQGVFMPSINERMIKFVGINSKYHIITYLSHHGPIQTHNPERRRRNNNVTTNGILELRMGTQNQLTRLRLSGCLLRIMIF